MRVLSPRQQELLSFVAAFQAKHGYAPTYRQMGKALGYAESNLTSRPATILASLERYGFIRRRYGRACSVELLKPAAILINGEPYRFIPITPGVVNPFRKAA